MNIEVTPGQFGFLLAAIGYLLFWALQLTVRVQTSQKSLLSAYTLCSVLWAVHNGLSLQLAFITDFSFVIETIQKSLLLLFLLSALSKTDISLRQWLALKKVRMTLLVLCSWLIAGWFILHTAGLRLMGTLLLVIVMLAMVETLYRQSGGQKWQFKPLIIAVGICLLLDFYLLAEAALLSKINQQTWQARGFVNLFMLPFLVVAVKRIKSWGINVYVSRDIVLQSSLVLAAGIYLCLLAVVGYYLSYIGGNWTTLLQVVFVVAGTAVLGTLVFSDGLRRKGRVFIEKHFFANTFDYREKWVELTRELKKIEFANENTAQVCLSAWCHAIGYSHGALVKLQQEQLQVLATQGQLEFGENEHQALQLVIREQKNKLWLLDFSDKKDNMIIQLRSMLAQSGLTFSILIPILKNNQLWGFCVLESNINEKLRLNWELRDYLNAVTEQIASYLFMDEASKALSENAQFVAFSRMSAFVVHDLKNVKAQIDMLLKNAQKHRHNPEFVDDAFTTIEAMQSRLQNMLAQLTNKQSGQEQLKKTAVGTLLQTLIAERCSANLPLPVLVMHHDCQLTIDTERFANVLFHLIDNAQHATADDGEVRVVVQQSEGQLRLEIIDTGCGMSQEFIQTRLFKPFDTTKGNAGMGIGAYDALTFVQQQQGQLLVSSEVGRGTTFTILLPLH